MHDSVAVAAHKKNSFGGLIIVDNVVVTANNLSKHAVDDLVFSIPESRPRLCPANFSSNRVLTLKDQNLVFKSKLVAAFL